MRLRQINDEVFFADDHIVKFGDLDTELLKGLAQQNQRKSVRVCTHSAEEDKLHEMFIVHARDTYVRPHKHLSKSVSFHVIEGEANVVIFSEEGDIIDVIPIGGDPSRSVFYCRVPNSHYYTQLVKSDFLVFHETTNGPFDRSDTVWAPWSPDQDYIADAQAFKQKLELAVVEFSTRTETLA